MTHRPTLRDIAKITGLHFTTVGLALRGDPRISKESASKVKAAASGIGYTQDAMLSALSTYRHVKPDRFAGVIAYLHTFPMEVLATNARARLSYEAACARARENGFKLEAFHATGPNMTPRRLSELLVARGIQGLVIAPLLPLPGPFPDLDWERFSAVAIGYSITGLHCHRAAFHQTQSMQLLLSSLRKLGYRRIGLQISSDVDQRTHGHFIGAYLADQIRLPQSNRVEPLFTVDWPEAAKIGRWIAKAKPDCLIVSHCRYAEELRSLKWRFPEDVGLAVISRDGDEDPVAGIDEQSEHLAVGAIDFVVSLLRANERGLPRYPRYELVEGRWVWRPTVRPPKNLAANG